MKTQKLILKKINIIIFIITSITTLSYSVMAQPFQMSGTIWPVNNRFGVSTTGGLLNANLVRAMGVGAFTSTNHPLAALHVNANLLPGSPDFGAGDVFRTTGPATNINAWRMFTGTGNGTEKFSLFVPAATNNLFLQATQNGHMFFNTNSMIREKINGSYAAGTQYTINTWTWANGVNTGGYVGIGSNDLLPDIQHHLWTDKGPFSLLHLNGDNFGHVQELGYRPWMKIGMTITSNDDLMYVGHKKISDDITDAVFVWSDNPTPTKAWGPDNMLFIFTRDIGTAPNSNLTGSNMDGREIMRLTALGNVGIGPRFSNANQPQSALHINRELDSSAWLQITNENITGHWKADGFRIGIIGTTGDVRLNQQENQDMLFYTGAGVSNISRMIIKGTSTTNQGFVGIGSNFTDPQNTLEINSPALNATATGGSSGLRFTDLRDGISPPISPNPSQGVLSVDGNGDVIYVLEGGGTGTGFGAACAAPTTPYNLTDDWRIGLNDKNLYFDNGPNTPPDATRNNIVIGNDCNYITKAKLDVLQQSNTNATVGISIINQDPGSGCSWNNSSIGLASQVLNPANIFRIAGLFTTNTIPGTASSAIALLVPQNGGRVSFGFNACQAPQGYQLSINGNSYFDGNINVNGNIDGAGTFSYISDIMFKTNIDSIYNALNIINQLKPKSYYFDTTNSYGLHFNGLKQYGLIAQDVELVLPELVSSITKSATYDSSGSILTPSVTYKNLNYNAFFAILIEGMKEMNAKNDSLDTKLNGRIDSLMNVVAGYELRFNQLEAIINQCCENTKALSQQTNDMTITNVELANNQAIVLDQNVPNPFAESTVINYFIPDNINYAVSIR